MLWNEFRFAISWATLLSTGLLNFTRNELVNNSFDDVDDVTRANDESTESPKSREHHFSGIFQFSCEFSHQPAVLSLVKSAFHFTCKVLLKFDWLVACR